MESCSSYVSGQRLKKAHEAYDAVGLVHNPKKGFEGEVLCNFWGVDVDGLKGLLRSSQKRLWPSILVTLRVCKLGLATFGLLECLAGVWVSLLGVRPRLFSAMDIIFEPLGVDAVSNTVVRLSGELTSELVSLSALGTLAVVNLRAGFAPFVSATDASSGSMAGVRADLPPKICEEVARHVLRKGIWTRRLGPGAALLREQGVLDAEDEVPDEQYKSHPLWDTLARCLHYRVMWRRKVTRAVHINVSELKAFTIEERRIAANHSSVHVPYGLDSQVALGSIVKGRSCSKSLNTVMRRSMPYAIGADLYSLPMYYHTSLNRADGPTRGSEPADPDLPLPPWWDDLMKGDCESFDAWLRAHGPDVADETLPFEDIAGHQDLDLRPTCHVRKDARKAARKEDNAIPQKEPAVKSSTRCDAFAADDLKGITDVTKSLLPLKVIQALEGLPRSQYRLPDDFKGFYGTGSLDLLSGAYGVARQLVRNGSPWVLTYEWNHSSEEDLLQQSVRDQITGLVSGGAFATCSAAPICASFSVAVTPPVRSSKYPRGTPGMRMTMRQKVKEGNSHADFLRLLIDLFDDKGIWYVVENPDTSWLWRQKRWERWRNAESEDVFRFCFCRFGTAWKKPTKIATNTKLKGTRMPCLCKNGHIQLRGMHPEKKIPWTMVAQPYPRGLSRLLATALCQCAGWLKRERLNVSGCARVGSLRTGEATNPGPRRRGPAVRDSSLFDLQLRTTQTLALEVKVLNRFKEWCRTSMPTVDLEFLFASVPMFLVQVLVRYADYEFKNGGALSNLRHLLLACQRMVPPSRALMAPAWEMVERWESISPVHHRTPVPEVFVQALCVLGWHHGWFSWVGATLLAFYGAGRLGEVLRCSREDLVLPADAFESPGSPVFLRLRSFKSQNRQPAKIQRMKVVDKNASLLLTKIFAQLHYDQPLFGSTAYQYRKRWDTLLQLLGVEQSWKITPGGLRGGAAVLHYRQGRPIQDLLWLLPLRSQTTLESYLREVAALNTFV